MIAKRRNKGFTKVSSFLIQKFVTTCDVSPVTHIRKAADRLLIETLNNQQEARLLTKEIGDLEVVVNSHATIKTAKTVMAIRGLLNCTG